MRNMSITTNAGRIRRLLANVYPTATFALTVTPRSAWGTPRSSILVGSIAVRVVEGPHPGVDAVERTISDLSGSIPYTNPLGDRIYGEGVMFGTHTVRVVRPE